jgi:pimeloyl-ACP methyl ester carboxylesterase
VPDEVLDDLQRRLQHARWPDEPPGAEPWQYGTDLRYLQRLVEYWRTGFDWRAHEAKLNAFPQFVVPLDGIDLHYLHVQGRGPDPIPLLLSHGWPGSVWEFHKLIPLLTDNDESFTVVAPSLPGYTLSFKAGQRRFGLHDMADTLARLMVDVLGYDRFGAQGGDWGSFISASLGLNHANHVIGIHLNLLPLRRDQSPPEGDEPELVAYRAELSHWIHEETGYSSIQGTKPQTLAYALTDSPVGLAAWIVEKFSTWTDNSGDLEQAVSRDDVLTNIMLYWTSGAIGSSFWPYYFRHHAGWDLPGDRRVEIPMGYAAFPRDILHPPRRLAERAFANIQRWSVMHSGGHFAALERPDALAAEIRQFFRPLRAAKSHSGAVP